MDQAWFGKRFPVITSYSIHYTKLYELTSVPFDKRFGLRRDVEILFEAGILLADLSVAALDEKPVALAALVACEIEMNDDALIRELRSQIAGLIPDIDVTVVPRKDRRTMTAMGIYALMAAREALSRNNFV